MATDRAIEPFLDVGAAARMGGALARRHSLPTSYRPGALQAQLTELSIVACYYLAVGTLCKAWKIEVDTEEMKNSALAWQRRKDHGS